MSNAVYLTDDLGYVKLLKSMGDDLTIVNAARKSFDNSSQEFGPREQKLLRYLYINEHMSPFEMVEFMFEVDAPLFVVRQWQRHRTCSYNEVSRRYTSEDINFYVPSKWREQSDSDKQASEGELPDIVSNSLRMLSTLHVEDSMHRYRQALKSGACREQARMLLPQSMRVPFIAKVDLRNLLHFIRLRSDSHAQYEMQQFARALKELVTPIVPHTMAIFEERSNED
jgi:thymidylate synthase (FAD)